MIKRPKNLFLFIFTFWFSIEFLSATTIEKILFLPIGRINRISNYFIIMLLAVQIVFCQTYKKREMIVIAAVSVPFLITAAYAGSYTLLSAWLFIVAAKNTDFDKLVSVIYQLLFFMIPMVILLCLCGVIGDNTKIRDGASRYSLGFMHPNQLGVRLLLFVICHLYLHRNRLKSIDYGIAFATALFIYLVPNSQSSCMCLLILIVLLLFYQICRKYNEILSAFQGKLLLILAAAVNGGSILLSCFDVKQNEILWQFNVWMSARFSEGYKTLKVYGVPLWGQPVYVFEEERIRMGMTDGAGKLLLDNAYMLLLIKYGILSYLIFSAAYLLLMNYYRIKKQYVIMIILFVYAVYGIMENGLVQAYHNIFLISFSNMLYGKLGENNGTEDSKQYYMAFFRTGRGKNR